LDVVGLAYPDTAPDGEDVQLERWEVLRVPHEPLLDDDARIHVKERPPADISSKKK
jgi:hypothetical protein